MKPLLSTSLIISLMLLLVSCETSPQQETSTEEPSAPEVAVPSYPMTQGPLTVSPLEGSPAYETAALTLAGTTPGEGGEMSFDFEVENYELGVQTEPESPNGLANSGKGQHIHFIVDNGPYSAYYEQDFTHSLEEGQHVILAFLSRSYHESVKNPNAFVVEVVNVGDQPAEEVDLSAPHMFYSRPKGTYSGADTEKLLLDFYLLNVELSPEGNKVRATVNGNEFLFSEWQPYVVEGLEPGEVTVKLELIDAAGNVIPGPFNTVERTVTLEAGA